jgi:hypothetical protein
MGIIVLMGMLIQTVKLVVITFIPTSDSKK